MRYDDSQQDRQITHQSKNIVITVQEAKHWTNITESRTPGALLKTKKLGNHAQLYR